MKTRKFITLLKANGIDVLQSHISEEIKILQDDNNEILSVDVRPGLNEYIATITYLDTPLELIE